MEERRNIKMSGNREEDFIETLKVNRIVEWIKTGRKQSRTDIFDVSPNSPRTFSNLVSLRYSLDTIVIIIIVVIVINCHNYQSLRSPHCYCYSYRLFIINMISITVTIVIVIATREWEKEWERERVIIIITITKYRCYRTTMSLLLFVSIHSYCELSVGLHEKKWPKNSKEKKKRKRKLKHDKTIFIDRAT